MSFISRKSLFSAQVTKIFLVYFYWLSSPSRLFNTLTFLNKMGNEISSALQDNDDDIIMLHGGGVIAPKRRSLLSQETGRHFLMPYLKTSRQDCA